MHAAAVEFSYAERCSVFGCRHYHSAGLSVNQEHKDVVFDERIELCNAADVARRHRAQGRNGGARARRVPHRRRFYVTDDACTHGPGSLSDGYITDDVIECDFHNGAFNIKTGEVVAPPCMIPVRTYRTTVEGGKVYIEA